MRRVSWRTACLGGLLTAVSACGATTKATGRSTTAAPSTAAHSTTAPATGTPATGTPATTAPATGPPASTTAINPTAPSTATNPARSTARGPINPTSAATARFIGQADQICGSANSQLLGPQRKVNAALKVEQTKGSAAHRTALAQAVRAESAVAGAELTRLRRLNPPVGDGPVVGRYVGAVAGQVALINQLAAAVVADDGQALTVIGGKLTAGKATVDGLAAAYGFRVCGNTTS